MLEAWRLRNADEHAREEALRLRLRELSDAQRQLFYQHYSPRLRDPDTYAVLNWFFLAGIHHFYLRQYLAGVFDLALMMAGFVLLFVIPPLGAMLIALVLLLELPALFRSQLIAAHHNTVQGERVMAELFGAGPRSTAHGGARADLP